MKVFDEEGNQLASWQLLYETIEHPSGDGVIVYSLTEDDCTQESLENWDGLNRLARKMAESEHMAQLREDFCGDKALEDALYDEDDDLEDEDSDTAVDEATEEDEEDG